MIVNKYKFTIPTNDKFINLPVEIKWDFYGRDDSIEEYVEDVLEEVIGVAEDFEVGRFSHQEYVETNNPNIQTSINYNFFFFNGADINTSVVSDWQCSYIPEGFTPQEVYYYRPPFTKSFFKLDFYDTPNTVSQTNYFTIIIPVQQGKSQSVTISQFTQNVNIRIPSYTLDYVGDKEGFFIYWLRKPEFVDISTFYMSAKFFDGKEGVFVKMMNKPQSSIPSDKFVFNGDEYFYYKVTLDYDKKNYVVTDTLNQRVGTSFNPINWYEYVNPPQ
jgi:hypothetical protein